MHEHQNYTPGIALYVFGSDASLKFDATENNGSPTLNIEMSAGKRVQGKQGLFTNHSAESLNIQLDTFELIGLAAVFLGHLPQLRVRRHGKYFEIKRQQDFHTGGASCYAVGSSGNKKLSVPITSPRIFCASMLCMSRLMLLHPGIPASSLHEALAATGACGIEFARTDEKNSLGYTSSSAPMRSFSKPQERQDSTDNAFVEREIPEVFSTDPARKIPRPL